MCHYSVRFRSKSVSSKLVSNCPTWILVSLPDFTIHDKCFIKSFLQRFLNNENNVSVAICPSFIHQPMIVIIRLTRFVCGFRVSQCHDSIHVFTNWFCGRKIWAQFIFLFFSLWIILYDSGSIFGVNHLLLRCLTDKNLTTSVTQHIRTVLQF